MSDTTIYNAGWAIRRENTCLITKEVDCGKTAGDFHACCPSSTECPSQYNVACCPSGKNCTSALVTKPHCANSSWIMYDNGGYFCCEQGQVGYDMSGSDGCIKSGAKLPDGASPFAVIDQVTPSPSSSSSSTASPTSTPSQTQSPSSDSSSSGSHTGAIVGGVVGGVAAIAIIAAAIFFFLRRRKSQAGNDGVEYTPYVEKDATPMTPAKITTPAHSEMDGMSRVELPPNEGPTRTYELA
ncbi:uncharacterized protein F4822DRAFT_182916 [Hypoxylon trugodes]|uniref:uncharacterized protein n=1 Tax=Hypoxylon trugodes TaxID=326681 RepID=UPI0021953D5C|nr:uncharacterized protein F4822DRAFT_182916 [Hypoxylon trugodes]KAI1391353.1 hypothetical protein F4822DRAFT_182916 [Hypoxylon trugodes]